MRRRKSFLEWYCDMARAKKLGRWRFSPLACLGILVYFAPDILLVVFLPCILVIKVTNALGLPRAGRLALAGATLLGTACVAARLIYFALRESHSESKGVLCERCGNNLTANVSGVCPECGTEINRP